MFASNPFAALTETISAEMIQGYVILMAILVVGMTIYDMIHKKSAKYFFAKAKAAEANRVRELSGGDKIGIAVDVGLHPVYRQHRCADLCLHGRSSGHRVSTVAPGCDHGHDRRLLVLVLHPR